ncbi:MAG: hypothetical protein WBC44_19980 [Planctomycetaceae bacterium]
MFAKERDMTAAAAHWMKSSGLTVKAEFVTPSGVCDLVGLRFNENRVAHRLQLRQTKPIGSVFRAALLLDIPNVESGRGTTFAHLAKKYGATIPVAELAADTDRLIADRFIVRGPRGRLQKVNGWMPLHDRLVAVELKRTRIEEAMRQALNNLAFATESYVGLPADIAAKVGGRRHRWSRYLDTGIGLLSIASDSCEVVIQSRSPDVPADPALRLYCVEKFWRTRSREHDS